MTRAEKAVIGSAVIAVLAIAFLAILDYSGYGSRWMGFSASSATRETTSFNSSGTEVTSIVRAEDPRRAKTFWDWMQILVIPAAVAIGTFVLNQMATRRDAAMERVQKDREEALAEQRAQDTALQSYLDQLSKLLMDSDFVRTVHDHQDVLGGQFRLVVRARTLAALGQLDGTRKSSVVRFLYEANLINKNLARVSLVSADVREAKLSGAQLKGANLACVDLRGADLHEANLSGAILSEASLEKAELGVADLREAQLRKANLREADLSGADLSSAVGLSQEQIDLARGNGATLLPDNCEHPESWNTSTDERPG